MSRADLARRAALAPRPSRRSSASCMRPGLVVEPAEPVHPPERGALGRPPVLIALHRRAGVVAGIDFGKRHVRLAISDLSHALLAERHRTLDADLPAKEAIALAAAAVRRRARGGRGRARRGRRRRAWACPARCTARRASSATRRSFPAGPGRAPRTRSARRSATRSRSRTTPTSARSASGCGARAAAPTTWPTSRPRPASAPGSSSPARRTSARAGRRASSATPSSTPAARSAAAATAAAWRPTPARRPILSSLRDVHGDGLTLPDAVAFAVRGDAGCQRAIADAGTAIGTAVATLCNLFNPHRVVVGGDLGAAGELLLAPLRESLRPRRDPLRGGGRHGRPGRTGRPRRGVGRCCACVRARRRGH